MTIATGGARHAGHPRVPRRARLGCIAVAAVSLLVSDEPTYDPTAWLIWGRQISTGTLDTVAGPSWKPLPVAFTAPFSLFGDDAGDRALARRRARRRASPRCVLAYRVAHRFYGHVAGRRRGAVACCWPTSSSSTGPRQLRGAARRAGAAGLHCATSTAGSVEAFGWGVGGGAAAPEVWRSSRSTGCGCCATAATRARPGSCSARARRVALAWFVPEYIGSGDFFRGASRAREPVAGSPGASDRPFLDDVHELGQGADLRGLRRRGRGAGAGAAAAGASWGWRWPRRC